MLCAPFLLAAAVADPGSTLELAPAPGASPATTLIIAGQSVALDPEGRARVAASVNLTASGTRFYTIGGRAFYYPAHDTLVTWLLTGPGQAAGAEIVVKDHGSDSWETSRTLTASIESAGRSRKVRFVLAPGPWDLVLLVPGFAPAFASDVAVEGAEATAPPPGLTPAAHLKARVLDARSGRAPERWSAFLRRVGADPDAEETRFFATRAISSDRPALDFASLPAGAWELKLLAPGKGRRATLFRATKPAVADLGDLYISAGGSIRVTLAFPREVPAGNLAVRVERDALDSNEGALVLDSKSVKPRDGRVLEFEDLEPGIVAVVGENKANGIQALERVTVESGEAAEVALTFAPVTLRGRVLRGDQAVAAATLKAGVGTLPHEERTATSDALGAYELYFWTGQDRVLLLTLAPGDQLPFSEVVPIDRSAPDVEHDVRLPAGEIRGVVRDAETGAVLRGAQVHYSASRSADAEDVDLRHDFEMGSETDRDGRFRLGGLPPQPVDVEVKREGYAPARFPEVTPTPDGTELDVRLEKGFRIVGTIRDQAGAPVAGATVGLDPDRHGFFFTRTTSTSAAGDYEFRSVAPGEHVLGILRCGSTMVLRPVSVDPETESRERREDVRLEAELAPIAVRVEDDLGAPLANATPQWVVEGIPIPISDFQRAARSCGQSSSSDADGNMSLRGFPYGAVMALGPGRQALGTFTNDGSPTLWTIRIPRSSPAGAPGNIRHDETAPPIR